MGGLRGAVNAPAGYGAVPWRKKYSRMSFSSDQVTGTVFSHLNMPFLPNSKFIENREMRGVANRAFENLNLSRKITQKTTENDISTTG